MSGSMDDVFERMMHFQRTLREFTEAFTGTVQEMQRRHDEVSPLWQDQFRREYDVHWDVLQREIDLFLNTRAPQYDEFLTRKLRALANYLNQ